MKVKENLEIFIITLKDVYETSLKKYNKLISNLKLFSEFKNVKINTLGIDGAQLVNKKINNAYMAQSLIDQEKMGVGGIGCTLSHVAVLKTVEKYNINKNILVFEEDAILNRDIFKILPYAPKDYDFIFLHSYWDCNYFDQPVNPENQFFRKIENLITGDCGAMCYLINGQNIKKIVKEILPIEHGIDWHLIKPQIHYGKKIHSLNKYLIDPNLRLCQNPEPVSLREELDAKFVDWRPKNI